MTQNVNTQDGYDTRAIAQAKEISESIAFLKAKAEYRGCMIWISQESNLITNTVLAHVKRMGYTLLSIFMYNERVYALFDVKKVQEE